MIVAATRNAIHWSNQTSKQVHLVGLCAVTIWRIDCNVLICYQRLDENKKIVRFVYSNHTRDSVALTTSPEETGQLYKAYLTLGKMLRDPANQIEHKMMPGDMICTNNSRVLHGRSAFTITGQQSRFLIGIHMDWDIMYSRMRVLAKKFNIPFLG